jgi:hypothetical protein
VGRHTLVAYPSWWTHLPVTLAAGVAGLDAQGAAVIRLPQGTSRHYANFHYQLTAVGAAAPELHVARQVRADQFRIAGGAPNVKVSWHLAGELKDARPTKTSKIDEEATDAKAAREYREGFEDLMQRVKDVESRTREWLARRQ